MSVDFLLFAAALVCFVLAAFSVVLHSRVNLMALGLALWVLTNLV